MVDLSAPVSMRVGKILSYMHMFMCICFSSSDLSLVSALCNRLMSVSLVSSWFWRDFSIFSILLISSCYFEFWGVTRFLFSWGACLRLLLRCFRRLLHWRLLRRFLRCLLRRLLRFLMLLGYVCADSIESIGAILMRLKLDVRLNARVWLLSVMCYYTS